jgi:hypothetical protein
MGSETFELRRFGWATPDRLEIDGRFVGLGEAPAGEPVLVLRGAESTQRLTAVTESTASDAADGEDWHAAFAWQETPTAFDVAELELGDDLVVELPKPRLDSEESGPEVLDVRRRGGRESLRMQAELLALRSELAEVAAGLQRSDEDLARARADLETERAARAADADRFRAGLAEMQEAADEAVADARAEVDVLRARADELAGAGEEAERLRRRLARVREILDDSTPSDEGDADGDATSP